MPKEYDTGNNIRAQIAVTSEPNNLILLFGALIARKTTKASATRIAKHIRTICGTFRYILIIGRTFGRFSISIIERGVTRQRVTTPLAIPSPSQIKETKVVRKSFLRTKSDGRKVIKIIRELKQKTKKETIINTVPDLIECLLTHSIIYSRKKDRTT